jgi:hypothetical protein
VKDAFKRIDINGDGKLTKREMLAGEEFTVEEVSKLKGRVHCFGA